MRKDLRALPLFAALLLAGCGGGVAGSVHAPRPLPTSGAATAPLTVVIHVPAATAPAAARIARYVSSATAELSIAVAPDGKALNFATSLAHCSNGICSTTVNAPVGKVDIEIDLLDSHGRALSIAQTVTTIAPASANTVSVVFEGVPSSITLTPIPGNPTSFTTGVAGTIPFRITIYDAAGQIISGQGNTFTQVTLATNDTTGAISLTPSALDAGVIATTFSGKAPNVLTVGYDGTTPTSATISLTATDSRLQTITVNAPALAVSGLAPAFSASNAVGVNVATQQNGNTWLGYVPAGVTKQSAVAVSLQMRDPSDTSFYDSNVSFTLGGSAQPFAARRTVRSAPTPAFSGFVYDIPHKPLLAKLRAQGRPIAGDRAASFARRARSLTVGTKQNFWVYKFDITSSSETTVSTPYVLRALTPHGAIWIDATQGTPTSQTSAASVTQLANDFETTWSLVSQYYGSTSYAGSVPPGGFVLPACDSSGYNVVGYDTFPIPDPGYMNVLITDQSELGAHVGGYNAPGDYFPQSVMNCIGAESNAAPTITVGYSGSGSALEVMAHEYSEVAAFVQHAIARGGLEEGNNVLDGLATVAQDLVLGHPSQNNISLASDYLAHPENYVLTQFAGFENGSWNQNCDGCYGETYLFFRYLVDRFGTGVLAKITQSGEISMANISAATGVPPQQLIEDFATMLAVSGTGITPASDPVTNLQTLPLRAPFTDANGHTWSAQQLTPQPAVVLTTGTPQTVDMLGGAFVFLSVPAPGANGSAIKLLDQQSQRSLWLGLATK